ncbi:hypothetical protein ASPVEDRAFT_47620 [Aspergillus versicolor CBS 583.65]|uniref:Uncharacterized protein n=1 Tax=Aspergillus versicolor CBS 583.65 TaxID=1036611 RepID=A0A1L9Q451_ASPVE|nr:uncharacterized protein ASPVEDRAFT_47620 [Aspergillus versicolor CBS 583.65]OJJ08458.1 hypothetical protein ASPVEDRAFT_47620 [Aspergillus versicolor CBS 583.65]
MYHPLIRIERYSAPNTDDGMAPIGGYGSPAASTQKPYPADQVKCQYAAASRTDKVSHLHYSYARGTKPSSGLLSPFGHRRT